MICCEDQISRNQRMSTVAHVSQSHAIRVETVEQRKQTPPACVYHGFDLVPFLPEAGSDAFETIHGLRTLVERCCDRVQLFHELQTLGVLREEIEQLVKAVVDATIGFLTKRWKYWPIEIGCLTHIKKATKFHHFLGVISGDVVDAHVLPHVVELRSHQMRFRTVGQLDEISHDRLKFEVAVDEMETIPNESVTYTQ